MKDGSYISNENLNDYARSDMFEWVVNLWNHSDQARIIMLHGSDFKVLMFHPCVLQGVGGGWIEVHNTGLFFPYLGLTIINSDVVVSYMDVDNLVGEK